MESVTNRQVIQSLSPSKRNQICEVLQDLVFTEQQMKQLMKTFEDQINYANNPNVEEQKKCDLWWGYTFVNGVLDGNENGKYLGLDLGGTNFRVILTELVDGNTNTRTTYYTIPHKLFTGTAEQLFDHIASSIQLFLTEENVACDNSIPLGFSFSFLLSQTSLKHSTLTTWGKCFKCTTGVGLDPCILLEEAIARRGGLSIPVDVVARIGDSTGTLMAGINVDKNCMAGLILGTGANVCVIEERDRYKRIAIHDSTDQILVDTEFGALGDNGCLDFCKNEFEMEVDKYSSYPGQDTFEKSFSGMFIGELVRLCLVKLIRKQLLFGGACSNKLSTRWSFEAKHVSAIERDSLDSQQNTGDVLKEFQMDTHCSVDDTRLVQEVCFLVSQRGAFLLGTALAVLLKRMNKAEISVAVDGSLYEHHPNYHHHMMTIINKLLPGVKVKLFLIKDGSGAGAAFVAAVATRHR